jgi:putative Holliday junction resolvase
LPESESGAREGRALAFDFGTKRIGVAVGDTRIRIAHPLTQIAFEDNRRRFDAIAQLVDEWQPFAFVVGMPSTGAANDHPLASQVRRFAQRLRSRFGLPVDFVDEHLTSWAADEIATRVGVRKGSRKDHIDALAACAILELWFEAGADGKIAS